MAIAGTIDRTILRSGVERGGATADRYHDACYLLGGDSTERLLCPVKTAHAVRLAAIQSSIRCRDDSVGVGWVHGEGIKRGAGEGYTARRGLLCGPGWWGRAQRISSAIAGHNRTNAKIRGAVPFPGSDVDTIRIRRINCNGSDGKRV